MNDLDTAKLKRAFIDATILKAQAMMETQPEPIVPSKAHLLWMRDFLHTGKPPRKKWTTKKRVIALLIAALFLLLSGCAVRGLIDFFVTRFDKYDRVEQASVIDGYPDTIKDNIISNIFFTDYELVSIEEGSFVIRAKWEKADGSYIAVNQGTRKERSKYFDNEKGEISLISQNGDQILYYLQDVQKHVYIFLCEYEFIIESSSKLSFEELSDIIYYLK